MGRCTYSFFFFSSSVESTPLSVPTRKFVHVLEFSHQSRFNNYPGVCLLTAYANDSRFVEQIKLSEIMNEFIYESCSLEQASPESSDLPCVIFIWFKSQQTGLQAKSCFCQ